jgi:hypothetical protein
MPRPSGYTEEIAMRLCTHVAEGKSLNAFCKMENNPHISMVYRWLQQFPAFRENYTQAKQDSADTLADGALEICDTPQMGTKTITKRIGDKETVETIVGDMTDHRRLQVDTRKWIAANLKPKVYGPRSTTTHQGPDGGPIPTAVIAVSESSDAGKSYLAMITAGRNAALNDKSEAKP